VAGRLDDVIRAADVRTCLPGGGSPKAQGLYRPGVPFRVLVDINDARMGGVRELEKIGDGVVEQTTLYVTGEE